MPTFSFIRAVLLELRLILMPRSAIRVLNGRLHQGKSEDPLSDASILMELYQRLGKEAQAREQYELVTGMMRTMRAITGPKLAVSHCMVLVSIATFERDMLHDQELAEATARRAVALAQAHNEFTVVDLAHYRFPNIRKNVQGSCPEPGKQRTRAE